LLLGGAIGIIASQGGSVPLPRMEAAKAAAFTAPDFRTQPNIAPVPPAELAQIRADAYAHHSDAPRDDAQASAPRNAAARARLEPVQP
jgi:hypothetical protein